VTPDVVLLVAFAWLGLAVGSFLNVCIHRIPLAQSIAHPPSRCPRCGYTLRWYDNIPVVSYAILGGRCRGCRAGISVRYPIVELLTMGIFLLHYAVLGWSALLVVRLLFACALIVLFAIDLEHQLLPDRLTLPGIAVGLVANLFVPPGLVDALIGAALGYGILWAIAFVYFRATGQHGMGGGDLKMLAMVGAFLGWKMVVLTVVLSSVAGAVIGLAVIFLGRGDMKAKLPYGTFLALAALFASLAGEPLVSWYVDLLN
jgi:leader peptidase (prepilin peptidase)/N-methyltransferase